MAFHERSVAARMLAASMLLGGCGGGEDDTPPTVRDTSLGRIQGSDDSAATGTYAWKGVPFARPPVGALRWKAPVDPDAWTGTRAATEFGSACVQYGRIYGPGANNTYDETIATTLNQAVGSEDCLYLNVWRPASGEANLPVIVFGNFGPSLFANVMSSTANRAGRLDLSDAMMQSIAAFACNGDPNNAALGVTWPAWPSELLFDATATEKRISVK